MAISKKSLGKILAISLASAMAMSSLSAALVSVSAVADPALASNGNVDYADVVSPALDGEAIIKAAFGLSDLDDDAVDAVGGGHMPLDSLTRDLISAGFTYTDSEGLAIDLDNVEIEYKVTSGTSYLKYDKRTDTLTAQNKSGSATLQIKVTGEAEIGGGRDDKKVTFIQNVKFNVHEEGEIGLKASADDGTTWLNSADLNDLAAYGSIVKYQVVQYGITVGKDLVANITPLTVASIPSSAGAPAPEATQEAFVKSKIVDLLPNGFVEGDLASGFDAALAAAIKVDSDGKASISADDWNVLAGEDLIPAITTKVKYEEKDAVDELAAFKKTNAAKFYEVPAAPAGSKAATPLTPGAMYMESADGTDIAVKVTDSNGDEHTLYKAGDAKTLVVKSDKTIDGIAFAAPTETAKKLTVKSDTEAATALNEKTDAELLTAKVVKIGSDFYSVDGKDPAGITFTPSGGSETSVFETLSSSDTVSIVNVGTDDTAANAVWELVGDRTVVDVYEVVFDGTVENPDSLRDAVKVGDVFYYGTKDTTNYPNASEDLKSIVENAYKNAPVDEGGSGTGGTGTGTGDGVATQADGFTPDAGETITQIRFYAGSGQDLFDVVPDATAGNLDLSAVPGSDWERSTKTNEDKGVTIDTANANGAVYLRTNGSTGAGTVKVAVSHKAAGAGEGVKAKTDEITLDVRVAKAADFGSQAVTIDRSGSKTYAEVSGIDVTNNKNINGFEIRTTGTVTVENGTVGMIKDASGVTVNGGRTGDIDAAETAEVTVTEDGVIGDVLTANSVEVSDGGQAGNITADADVTLSEGTIAGIDVDGDVTIAGGDVTGNVIATGDINITSEETDSNDNPLDTRIGGNVTLLAGDTANKSITINNSSDDGEAALVIRGNVTAKHVATTDNDTATVSIGDDETTGLIQIGGVVEGEVIKLGGNGLVNVAGVRAASEVERTDDDGEIIESTIIFDGFNSAINAINNFADVKVNEGTVVVNGAVNTTNLTVNNDAQIVANSINVEDDIIEGGSIVVPAGKLTVTGSVDDSPILSLTGDLSVGDLAFVGNRGLVDAFDMGGITLRAERQSDGNYNYVISEVELNGLTAVGKDVALGVSQSKTVSVALDGPLPEGANITWESDDKDIATVVANGTSATITGGEVGTTSVTAKIVDANGRELGYDDATFDVNVLDHETVDSIGGDIGPGENEVDLDTTKKNMQVGQTYTFLVRGNNDVANLSVVSSDANVATVALQNGDDSRGALYTITAVADGKADIVVNYQGKTSRLAVKVGGFQLDTASKTMAPGQTYSFLAKNVPADQAGNVTLAFDNNIVDVVKAADDYNGRGVLYTVTAKAIGQTAVNVTYNGETEAMNVSVAENTGKLTLDTRSYTMPIGGTYTIGVKVEKNGTELTGTQVRDLINSGELVIRDSRSGHVVTHQVQDNGNIRVTGVREGTTYIMVEVVQNGQAVTHASVGVTVQAGATAHGDAARSISVW